MPFPVSPTADLRVVYQRNEVDRTYLVDLVLSPGGDLSLVTGLERLEQDVRRWLQVALGNYVFDVTWGDPLWAQRGRARPQSVVDLLQAALKEAEDAFLRAQAQAAADGYLSTDEMLDHFEDVQVTTYDTDPGRIDVLFTLVARSGNNRQAELWVPARPFSARPGLPEPLHLAMAATPSLVNPGGTALLALSYDGPAGDQIVLTVDPDEGALVLTCGLVDTSEVVFTVLTTPTTTPNTFPDVPGCVLRYHAPAVVHRATQAVVRAEALRDADIVATATVTLQLPATPTVEMHFEHPVLSTGATTQLLVTYTGDGSLQVSVPDGLGQLGHVPGDSLITEPGTWAISYTAPAMVPDPPVILATAFDGVATATAPLTIVLSLGGSMAGAAQSSTSSAGSMAGAAQSSVTSGSMSGAATFVEG